MATVSEHYARLLGPIYGWMIGDADEAAAKARREVAALGLPCDAGAAVDLGAGLGFHALALAEEGYEVTALDMDVWLLEALRERAGSLPDKAGPVHAVEADLAEFRRYAPGPLDAVLCMGDTLTHLPDRTAVEALASDVEEALGPSGVFCATFRDYTTALEGEERFIPVRSDEDRTLTVFLEYGPDVVTVHDLLHERGPGGWMLRTSSYPKLRLDPVWASGLFEARGMAVERSVGPGGLVHLIARAV